MPSLLSRFLHLQLQPHANDQKPSHHDSDELDEVSSSTKTDDSGSASSRTARGDIDDLYHDAAGYEKALKQTGCLERSSWASANVDSGFNHLVRDDMSDEERAMALQLRTRHALAGHGSRGSTPLSRDSGNFQDLEEGLLKISPAEVIDILKSEFGCLSTHGPEKLLLETDGCILMDVSIIVSPTFEKLEKSVTNCISRASFILQHTDLRFTHP